MELGWVSVVPPVAAIALAMATRQVIPSLLFGVTVGWTAMAGWDPLAGLADTVTALVDVFKSGYNTKVILFSALVGALITLTQRSGGVEGFVRWMQALNIGKTRRSASLVAWVTGLVVFVESSITCLVVGAVARPLSDAAGVSREKLAYVCDSTSAPVCILIPLNAWGAYVMGLLAIQGIDQPLIVLLEAIPLNFYALVALFGTLLVILLQKDFGPMKKAEDRARNEGKLLADGALPMISSEVIAMPMKEGLTPRKRNMLVPLAVLIVMMPLGLYLTGRTAILEQRAAAEGRADAIGLELDAIGLELDAIGLELSNLDTELAAIPAGEAMLQELGKARQAALEAEREALPSAAALELDVFNILGQGSGSTAVLWAVLASTLIAAFMALAQRLLSFGEVNSLILQGMAGLMPMAVIMVLAFAINNTCSAMETGPYVASLVEPWLSPALLPFLLFVCACFIAFSTGTSWGTFGIMMPIGIPLVAAMGGSLPLVVAAILGGGVFGDHCSPISDTTVISSMATACDHIDHVRTQLPYALVAAAIAGVGYLIAGALVVFL
ncbi:MAG: sodium:solute symporter [Deltaproteobacteria bacterium CG_4_9_14_3_um_filter_63_12]|nr:MAG: sodium:solute symporter [Deltaproteobacteria bacterium CG_4_9_14_3_um_filter_63_12]